jgi:hypothetical protein
VGGARPSAAPRSAPFCGRCVGIRVNRRSHNSPSRCRCSRTCWRPLLGRGARNPDERAGPSEGEDVNQAARWGSATCRRQSARSPATERPRRTAEICAPLGRGARGHRGVYYRSVGTCRPASSAARRKRSGGKLDSPDTALRNLASDGSTRSTAGRYPQPLRPLAGAAPDKTPLSPTPAERKYPISGVQNQSLATRKRVLGQHRQQPLTAAQPWV